MIEKKPLVTIVMPCLNEEAYVGKALRSLLDDWAIRNCEVRSFLEKAQDFVAYEKCS
jgi:hypothetical protein